MTINNQHVFCKFGSRRQRNVQARTHYASHVKVSGVSNNNNSVTGLEWPRGFQKVKVPRFHDNGTGWS